jgi:predicted signal transduction protein with EAL and GGDEF domain
VDGSNQKEEEVMPTFVQQSDTAANTLTVVSGSSTLIAFATAWLPVFSMIAACVAIVSGSMAAIYYIKKIKEK